MPSRGHLLLVYSDWTPAAIRGCKSGELLKRAVCVVARGSSVLWEGGRCWVNQWVSWRGFHQIVHTCVCVHAWNNPGWSLQKNNSHSLLRYNLMHLCFHQRAPTGCAHLRDLISISASRRFIRKTVNRAAADQFMMLSGSEQPATCALKTRFLYLIVPSYVASVSISMVTFHSRNPHCTSWGTCWVDLLMNNAKGDNGTHFMKWHLWLS